MKLPANVRELDVDVEWTANQDDAACAVAGDDENCLGALSVVRHAKIHGSRVVKASIKYSTVYLTTEDGTVWHGTPDANTAMLIAANDNPNYRPKAGVKFRIRKPAKSNTIADKYERSQRTRERKAQGLPMNPVRQATGPRPHAGRTLHLKPRGAVRFDRTGNDARG